MDSGGYPGCSRHLGEFIQSHCATCNQILCLKCLTTGHCGHDVKIYDDFLRDRREEVEAQVQRLKIIRQRVENQKAIFSKLSADLENFYEKTESKLESYMVVQDAMKEWKKNLTDELERKKSQQLQNLDMAVCNPDSKSFKIKIPKMFVDKRAELVSDVQMKVRELTPASIHFLTGKTLHRRYSHRLHRNCISLYENIEPNDIYDDILTKGQLEGYKEKDMSTQSNKQQQTTGYINVDEMCKKNELPPSLPPRPSCNRGHTGQFKQPCPLPRSKLSRKSKDMAMDLHSPSNVVSQSQPTNDGMHREQQCTDTTVPNKQFPEKQRIDNINDTSNLQKPSPLQRTPSPIHTGIVMKGNPSYEVSFLKQDAVATEESDNDTLYEKIEDINKTTLVPVTNPQNEPNEVYEDTTIASSRSPNIITNGCLAETPGESIDLYDVCVNPQGWLIFSDPTNCCLRILMDTTKSSERMTKRLKDDIQPWAVTYDSSNQRIIFATTSGLSQLQFGDTKLKKHKEKKLLKGISPKFISCTTTSNKEERMHVYATILPRGRERSIQCYDENGDFCRELEVAKMPCGIDHCQEYLVVATLQDGCLAKITPYGQSLWSNEVDAQKPGILQHPFGVVILPNEYIAVTESNAHRISIFSSEGKLVLRFGSHGSEPGMFDTPRGIAVRHSKELVVIDSGNNRIQIFFLDSIL